MNEQITSMDQSLIIISNLSSSADELSLFENVSLAVFLILLDFLTIAGNSLVVLAIIFDYHLRSPTHYLMGSLAMADLLIGTVVLPFSSFQIFFNSWPFGSVLCTIWKTVDVLCCTASIYLLLAISVDRYVGVTRPLSYSSIITKQRVYMIIAAVWVLSLAVSLAGIVWKSPQDTSHLCEVNNDLLFSFFSASLSFYIPLVLICIIYYRIYTEARIQMNFMKTGTKTSKSDGNSVTLRVHRGPTNSARKLQCTCNKLNDNNNTNNNAIKGTLTQKSFNTIEEKDEELMLHPHPKVAKSVSCDSAPKSVQDKQPKKGGLKTMSKCPYCDINGSNSNLFSNTAFSSKLAKFKREKKAAKNLAIVVGCLVLCWMPFFIVLPIEGIIRPSENKIFDKLLTIFFWLGYCNSAMNPLIYAYSSREFRRAYKGLIQCNIRELNKKENLEKLSRLNYQNLANRSNYRNKSPVIAHRPVKFNLNSIYEENSLSSNNHSV